MATTSPVGRLQPTSCRRLASLLLPALLLLALLAAGPAAAQHQAASDGCQQVRSKLRLTSCRYRSGSLAATPHTLTFMGTASSAIGGTLQWRCLLCQSVGVDWPGT